jgi:hypothetical protein
VGWSAKCGCSHIKHIWYYLKTSSENPDIIHGDQDSAFLPDNISEYNTILIIRNPYKRLVSGFSDKWPDTVIHRHWKFKEITFRLFVNKLRKKDYYFIDYHHFMPQTDGPFDETILAASKSLKLFDIENIDYSYIEGLFDKKITDSVLHRKFGHESPIFNSNFNHDVCDLETKLYANKNVRIQYFYDNDIARSVTEIYKNDLIFFKKYGFDYETDYLKTMHKKSISVDSFDVFDTLLARTVRLPTDIFGLIEDSFPYKNFKELRIKSERQSNFTFDNIYHQFKLLTNETDETIELLKKYELTTEMNNTIPIKSNILKMQNGDICVSDMYLCQEDILKLLRFHNINANIKMYVSPFGKSSGHMWETLQKTHYINSHTGDNYHSDIVMAKKYNIHGIYTQIHRFTALESRLIEVDFDLCKMFRTFRLSNTYEECAIEYNVYDNQAQYNIPILLFICRQLSNILTSENRTKVLFFSRDGFLIMKLFMKLYPQYESIYTYSSRIINNNYTDDYVEYLKSIYSKDDCLMFDINGSFTSGRHLFMSKFGHLPRLFVFSFWDKNLYYDGVTHIVERSEKLEDFNYAPTGTLVDFKNNTPYFLPSEFDPALVNVAIQTVEDFVDFVTENRLNEIKNATIFDNTEFWVSYYYDVILRANAKLTHVVHHSTRTLTVLANKYNSDKGNVYKCAHHYTLYYQQIISDLLRDYSPTHHRIELLEIGLNRDDTASIPSLLMWNEYFHGRVNITGFDINRDFLKFNNVYPNIQIIQGDQSLQSEVARLKNKTYDIIIDDGWHASKHQQISFKSLWSAVKSGGFYVIENLHFQPEAEPSSTIKTKQLFENWKDGKWITTEWIDLSDMNAIIPEIESIQFSDSNSKNFNPVILKNAFLYIKKK